MRFRLLSYLAAILLLSGVLGTNLTPVKSCLFARVKGWKSTTRSTCYGWPWVAWSSELVESELEWKWMKVPVGSGPIFTSGMPGTPPPTVTYTPPKPVVAWHWPALAIDILIGLAIPFAGLLACEFVLRRYAGQKERKTK